MHGAPTLTIPLLLGKFSCPFNNKSRGEEYRIGNVGGLYFLVDPVVCQVGQLLILIPEFES